MAEYDLEKLKEKHKDVFNNPDVQAIAKWRDRLYNPDPDFSEEKYSEKAKQNLPKLLKLFESTSKLHQ